MTNSILRQVNGVDPGQQRRQPHVAMVPYPLQGHISPLMQLSRVLASKGCRVTFIATEFQMQQMLKSCPHLSQKLPDTIHLVGVPDGLPPDHDRNPFKPDLVFQIREGAIRTNSAHAVISLAKSQQYPITCIIHDSFVLWAHDVAANLGIPRVAFWSNSLTCLSCSYSVEKITATIPGLDPFDHLMYMDQSESGAGNVILDGIIPGLPSIRARELPFATSGGLSEEAMRSDVIKQMLDLPSAHAVICNSTAELETSDAAEAARLHDELSATLPVKLYPIGPLFQASNDLAGAEVSLWEEDNECLSWLDTQQVGSVVYVSFGSSVRLAEEELREIGKGLVASGKPFLWVVKTWASDKNAEQLVGDEVMHMMKDGRAKIVKWAPQLRVLAHDAVGAFFSHCGWNSTLESLSYGVPVLCLPLMLEQVTNCWLLCEHLQHGLRVCPDIEGGLAAAIESGVKRLMDGCGVGQGRRSSVKYGSQLGVKALEAFVESTFLKP